MVPQNRLFKTIYLILIVTVAILLSVTLSACAKEKEEPPKDVREYLIEVMEEFNSRNNVSISGKVTIAEETAVSAVYDKANKIIDYTYGDKSYRYVDGTYYLKKEDGYVIKETDGNYTRAIKSVPFNLALYKYDPDYVYDVQYDADKNIVISFYKLGVVRSFGSDLNVAGGTFTIFIEENKAASSRLDTILTDKNKKKRYSAEYVYGIGSPQTDIKVLPTDEVEYADFAIRSIDAHNENKTIHSSLQDRDLGVNIKSIPVDADKINRVFCIQTEEYVTLNIVYSAPTLIEHVHSSVSAVAITYDSDYNVTQIVINENNRYYLA